MSAALPSALAVFTATASAIFAPALLAAPIPAESRLTAATVYPDRAVVTRAATSLAVPAGTVEIVFSNLPASLQDESVQVSARGSVAATLLDVATRTVFATAEPDVRVKALEDQLLTLRREERALNDQAAVLDAQRALLANIEKGATDTAPAPAGSTAPARPSLDDYAKLLAFSADQRTRLDAASQKLERDRTALAEKIAAAEAQLNEIRGRQPGRRATKSVTVRLATPAAGKLDVSLAYTLPGASWAPAYDARLHTEKRLVQLDAFGLVRNATGEDWQDVALTLSTARPGLGGAAPEIAPWYVDVNQAIGYGGKDLGSVSIDTFALRSRKPKRPDPSSTMISQEGSLLPSDFGASFGSVAAPEPIDSAFAAADLTSAATSASYKIATPVTLASDNTPQRLPLGSAASPRPYATKPRPSSKRPPTSPPT